MIRLSDNYLHSHLAFFDAPTDSISVPHLFKAAGDTGEFFFPITILYSQFPGLRKTISEKYDTERVIDSIKAYFWDDFDEGIHLWGQYHDESRAEPDWVLRFSIQYLIGQERFDLVEELITRIDEEGQVGQGMLADIGMIDLARGRFGRGLDRLRRAGEFAKPLYAGLADLKMGDDQGAIRELVKTVNRNVSHLRTGPGGWNAGGSDKNFSRKGSPFAEPESQLVLDSYGFPEMAVANRILINMDDYGESREDLERDWDKWIGHLPFDAPVAEALVKLYERRLEKLDREKDAAVFQRFKRKLRLVQSRAARYRTDSFSQGE